MARITYCKESVCSQEITPKNQLTLPKAAAQAVGATEYFDVEVRAGLQRCAGGARP
jgi:hypothetical protein